jgi:hypothetical protein
MSNIVVKIYLITFAVYFIALNLALILAVRPGFIKRIVPLPKNPWAVYTSYILLFLSSLLLGVLAYALRVTNSIIII